MNIALLLSGGRGSRMGMNIPKQYIKAGGRMIGSYCLETLSAHPDISGIQIVADPGWQEEILGWGRTLAEPEAWASKFRGFSLPGKTRQISVFHGLEDIKAYGADEDFVLIHDAARPLLSSKLIADCLKRCVGHDGAMPVLPMKDTVYFIHDGRKVDRLLDRSTIYAGQAPEVFVLGTYYEANRRLMPDKILKINGSAEPAIMAGLDVAVFPGDERNFKITTRADLERFIKIVESEHQ